MKPFFIAIDGIDGTGKSTQVKLLSKAVKDRNIKAVSTKEPGGTAAGHLIREILLDQNMMLNSTAEILLFCADRAEHQDKIKMYLNNNISVICDRFLPSTYAYQVFGRGVESALLDSLVERTVKIFPDLTIILDLEVSTAVERAKERLKNSGMTEAEGRFELEGEEFFTNVRNGFHWYAENFDNAVIIDASGTEDDVFKKIQSAASKLISW